MDKERNTQLDELKSALQRHEEGMMEIFLREGPSVLRERLGVRGESEWKLIFDYLVSRKNVLEKCAVDNMPFFKDLVASKGPAVLKEIFKIDSPEYRNAFQRMMDMVAVSHGAIYEHVLINRQEFAGRIMVGEGRNLRRQLCIDERKYDALWYEILELLRGAVCREIENETACSEGLGLFTNLMNGLREQRSLRSFSKMWAYSG